MHYSVKQVQPAKMTADSRQFATVDYPTLGSVLLVLLSLFIWRVPLEATFSLAIQNDEHMHILLILPVSIALIVFRRPQLASYAKPSLLTGACLIAIAVTTCVVLKVSPVSMSQ